MEFIAYFFEGAFLCNCVPHLVRGLQGSDFPTPFATPHGVGMSSPLINFVWGFFNLSAALLLFSIWPVRLGLNAPFAMFVVGLALIGVFSALHFEKVMRNRSN